MPRPSFKSSSAAELRERISFNAGWRFFRGDAPDAKRSLEYAELRPWLVATGTELLNEGAPKPVRPPGNPGGKVSFVKPDFDDSAWRELDVPHDWGIEGPFAQELPGETGKLPWQGSGWYRKRFKIPKTDSGGRVALDVDGAMAYAAIWLNGQFVGGWPYGYSSFQLDLTPYLNFGGENLLAIRLHNPPNSSRWYPGSGLFRNLWLVKTPKLRVAHWGTFVTTPRVTASSAIVNVDVTIENTTDAEVEFTVTSAIHELGTDSKPGKKALAESEPFTIKLGVGLQALRTLCMALKKPKRWTLERRERYVAVTTVTQGKKIVDRVATPFGVRTVRVDADTGFFLNEKHTPLKGVCMHHDLGALGSAVHTRALERQIEILQAMGCNAIRTSHNPPAPELLELCDRMGMLLMVEAFDCWRRGKKVLEGTPEGEKNPTYCDYAPLFDDWHERDLRAMIRRDRNHPSVVMWSIGNEVIEQWYVDGWKLSTHLAGIVREEDRTRPITSAFNGEIAGYSGFQTAVDIVGFNYKPAEYAEFRRKNPTQAVLGAETSSALSSRGEYFFPFSDDKLEGRADFQVSSYDLSAARWANPPDLEFKGLDEAPYCAGEFVWTGFDYLGEPTPYNSDSTNLLNFSDPAERERAKQELDALGRIQVPSRSSYFGIIDLAGFPKDRFYIYQARWRPELKMAHILPHWNWPERVGEVTPVHVYSAADEAELFLNGKSLGRRKRKAFEYRFRWDKVVYEPGELKVITRKGNKPWATAVQRTTGPAAKISLTADRTELSAAARDLIFITVAIADKSGSVVPRRHDLVRFSSTGPAEIIGVDNGDPTSFEPFQANQRKAFNGLALLILRSKIGKTGAIRVRAEADGLTAAEISLRAVR